MKTCKRLISLLLMFVIVAGLALSGHAVGYTLSGSVVSYGDEAAHTIVQLTSEDGSTIIDQKAFTGNQSNYQLSVTDVGTYTLTVRKANHATRNYSVTIDGSNIVLDVKICLLGDANCNGKINMGDVSIVYAHTKSAVRITDSYQLACADFNSDGRINMGDISRVYAINKGSYKPNVKEVTLSVWTPSNDQEGPNSWLEQMEDLFQKDHPEYKITWENGVCHEGDAGWFVGEDPEGAADVYMVANDQIGTLVNAGAIHALGGKYADQVLADNSETMINTVTYTDGNIYAFPMTNNTWFMYYNKSTYSEEDIKSLDTMLTKGNVAFPWETAWYSGTFFLANGGSIFGDKGIDTSAGIQFGKDNGGYEAALKMVQLASNRHLVNDVEGIGCQAFKDGSVAAYFSGSWDYSSLLEALGDNLGVAQLPTVEIDGVQKQMKAFVGSKAVAVNAHAEELDLATAFAAFLATPKAQKLRYEANNTIPAAATLVNDPVISQDPVALAEISNIANASTVQPFIPEMGSYWEPVGRFGGMIASGQITEANYSMYVDQLMAELNDHTIDDDSISLSVWAPEMDLSEGGWMEVMQEAFAAEHPELNIIWENGSCAEGDAGGIVSSDPESAADIYMFANDQLGTLVDAGAIMELTGDYLDQVAAYNSQILVNTVTHTDEGVYGFPVSNNTWFLYYNKDVFSEEDVKSLDVMLEKGRIAFPLDNSWYNGTFFLANGGSIFGDKGIDASAGIQFGKDNGGYEAALKMLELADNPNFINNDSFFAPEEMLNGSIDAFFSGSWDFSWVHSEMGDKLGVVQLPTVEINGVQKQMKSFAGSKAVAVNPHTDHPDLAIAFAAYISTPDAQMLRYQMCGVVPCAESLSNDPIILQNPVAVAEINAMNNTSVVQPSIPEMANYWTPMGNFGYMLGNGTINRSNYQQEVDRLMASLNGEIYEGGEEVPDGAITLSVWTPYEDQVDNGWLEMMQNSFAAEHPDLNIIWKNDVCTEGDAGSMVSIDPESAADIYMVANDQIGTLVNAGAIHALGGKYADQVLADNSETMINTVTYTDGNIYAFPMTNNTWFMYYNKSTYSEEDIKSLDTMLTKGNVAFPWETAWYSGTFFLANGGSIFGDKGIDASAGIQFGKDNGGYETALKMVQLASNLHLINDTSGRGYSGFIDGSIDAYFSGSWDYESLYDALGDQLGATQLPSVEIGGQQKQMKAFAGSKAVAVNPYAQNLDLATEFAAYLATPAAQKLRYECTGTIPAASSLSNDPIISTDPVALAEINTIANASIVQPSIPEMGNYWTPMWMFCEGLVTGEINENNYQEAVDHLMTGFENPDDDENDFNITNVEITNIDAPESITLRFHYHRPDGNYTDWDLWVWDDNESLMPPYAFEPGNDDVICTVEVPSSMNEIGFIVRFGDWYDKDVEFDQFVDLSGILGGTLDIYIESGIAGYSIDYNEDVVWGTTLISIDYLQNSNRLVLTLSDRPEGDMDISLSKDNDDTNIIRASFVESSYYLTFDQPLGYGSYTLQSDLFVATFDIT